MAQRTIDGAVFDVVPMPGERTFLMSPRIMPIFADVMALYSMFTEAFVSVVESGVSVDESITPTQALHLAAPLLERASPAISRVCEKMLPEHLKQLTRELLEGSRMNNQLLFTPQGNPIDVLLQGKVITYWKLIVFAIETSFPDFFALAGALRGSGKEPASSETSGT